MIADTNAGKRAVLDQLLEQGMVLVTIDARADGVRVPPSYAHDPQLRLNLSYRFGLPMELGDEGVSATLTFAGVPFACYLPWAAIYMLVSHATGQPFLFPADVPAELRQAQDPNAADGLAGVEGIEGLDGVAGREQAGAATPSPPSRAPRFEVVSGAGPEAMAQPQQEPPDPSDPSAGPARAQTRRGHLRVVK